MKFKSILSMSVVVFLCGLLSETALSRPRYRYRKTEDRDPIRSTGIGIRGSYWHMDDDAFGVSVINGDRHTSVDVGGGGGWLFFISRVDDNMFFELGFGAIGTVETTVESWHGEHTEVQAITPVVFGVRYELFSLENRSALRPYVSAGGGPYWFNDIAVREEFFDEEEVTVKTRVKAGGYLGGGVNFMFNSWLGLNFDCRYHFINFEKNHEQSDFEYGLGLLFMWGRYR